MAESKCSSGNGLLVPADDKSGSPKPNDTLLQAAADGENILGVPLFDSAVLEEATGGPKLKEVAGIDPDDDATGDKGATAADSDTDINAALPD